MVFPDRELPGLLIALSSKQCMVKGEKIVADAGLGLMTFVQKAIKCGLAGVEKLSGIPGSVGGAIVGNAGAYGHTISDHLVRVEVFDGRRARWIPKPACRFSYRESIFKRRPWIVLRAEFALEPGDSRALAKTSREIIAARTKKYPPGLACPGSFFKNIPVSDLTRAQISRIPPEKLIHGKLPAGYLLEEVGAKGMCYGHLEVAPYHGNLIVNHGGATYREVRALSRLLKSRVRKKFGIELEEEVRYIQ